MINYQILEIRDGRIQEVKRLSDGEIFNVGDIVSRNPMWEKESNIFIHRFDLTDELKVIIKQEDATADYPFDDLMYKCNPIFFTTHDGVDIKGGDKYYLLNPMGSIEKGIAMDPNISGNMMGVKGYYYYSRRKLAERHLEDDKPMYSLNDIAEKLNCDKGYLRGLFKK